MISRAIYIFPTSYINSGMSNSEIINIFMLASVLSVNHIYLLLVDTTLQKEYQTCLQFMIFIF